MTRVTLFTCLVLLLLFPFMVIGQADASSNSKFFFQFNITGNYLYRKLCTDRDYLKNYLAYLEKHDKPAAGYGVEFLIGYRKSDRVNFVSGLTFNRFQYRTEILDTAYISTAYWIPPLGYTQIFLNIYQYRYAHLSLSIPLMIEYSLSGSPNPFFLSAGLIPSYVFDYKKVITPELGRGTDDLNNELNLSNGFFVIGNLNFNAKFNLKSHLDLIAALGFNYSSNIKYGALNKKIYSLQFSIGIRKEFY